MHAISKQKKREILLNKVLQCFGAPASVKKCRQLDSAHGLSHHTGGPSEPTSAPNLERSEAVKTSSCGPNSCRRLSRAVSSGRLLKNSGAASLQRRPATSLEADAHQAIQPGCLFVHLTPKPPTSTCKPVTFRSLRQEAPGSTLPFPPCLRACSTRGVPEPRTERKSFATLLACRSGSATYFQSAGTGYRDLDIHDLRF